MSRKNRIAAMFLCIAMVIGMFPVAAKAEDSGGNFTDVSPTDWFYDAVQYTYQNGLMNGTGSNTFSPNNAANRAMIVTALYRMEKEPAVSAVCPFSDVAAGSYYENAVTWAASNKIVTGYNSAEFGPNDSITREQMALILYRYANYLKYNTDGLVSISGYSDADTVSSWAKDAAQWAVGEGMISGTSTTTLSPTNSAARAQIATILMRFSKKLEAYKEFSAKDVADFPGDTIINLDDSDETNFAVLKDDTVVADSTNETNHLVSQDSDKGVYVFSNIDEQISVLQEGDTFYAKYGSGASDYVLFKVASIEISGTNATITSEDQTKLSDYFEYVDIDTSYTVNAQDTTASSTASDANNSDLSSDPGQPNSDSGLNENLIGLASSEFKGEQAASFQFGIEGDFGEVTAEPKITFSLIIRYDKRNYNINEIQISAKTETNVTAKLTKNFTGKEDTYKKESPKVTIPIFEGVDAQFDVYFAFDVDASVSGALNATVTSETGTKWSNGQVQPIEESKSDMSADMEGEFNISLGVGVEVSTIVFRALKLSMSGEGGIEADAKADSVGIHSDRDEQHLCAVCIDGELDGYFKVEAQAELGSETLDKWPVTLFTCNPVDAKPLIGKFYISFLNETSNAEFGWGECPHKKYLLTICVADADGNRLPGTAVDVEQVDGTVAATGQTDSGGIFSAYLSTGNYTVLANGLEGYDNSQTTVDIGNAALIFDVTMTKTKAAYESKYLLVKRTVIDDGAKYSIPEGGEFWIPGDKDVVNLEPGHPETSVYAYDEYGDLIDNTVTGLFNHKETYTYDINGNMLTSASYGYAEDDSDKYTYTYDANGNMLTKTYSNGATTTYTYDTNGNMLTQTDCNGQTITWTYDESGNTLTRVNEYGETLVYDYDTNGNVLTGTDAWGNKAVYSYTYDVNGHILTRTVHNRETINYTYDTNGNIINAYATINGEFYYEATYEYELRNVTSR